MGCKFRISLVKRELTGDFNLSICFAGNMGQAIVVGMTGEMLWRERESGSLLGTTTDTLSPLGEGVSLDHLSEAGTSDKSEPVPRQHRHVAPPFSCRHEAFSTKESSRLCRAKRANIRQSRPESGLGSQVKKNQDVFPLRLAAVRKSNVCKYRGKQLGVTTRPPPSGKKLP